VRREVNPSVFAEKHAVFRRDYEKAYASLMRYVSSGSIEDALKYPDSIDSDTSAFMTFIDARGLVPIILHEKQVPATKSKAFDKAFRTFNDKKKPRNSGVWFIKNLPQLQLLLEAGAWPDKRAHEDRKQPSDRYTITNQTGVDITVNINLLEAASDMIAVSKIPRAADILYGDVYFVGQISRRKTVAALYYAEQDSIFILLVKRFETKFLHALIHEFGHRYYQKIWTRSQQIDWYTHHQSVARSVPEIELPRVGDVFDIGGRTAVVADYGTDTRGGVYIEMADGGRVLTDQYIKIEKHNALRLAYPTPYAATDPEEHFCEAFAMYNLGELPESHKINFEALVGIRATNPRHARLAERLAMGYL